MTLELLVTDRGSKSRYLAPLDGSIQKVVIYVVLPDGKVLHTLELDSTTQRARGDWL